MNKIIYKIYKKIFFNKYRIKITNSVLPTYYKNRIFLRKGTNKKVLTNYELIISLTSIPSRINKLWICTESLLRQSYKPNRIILWLSEDQFRDKLLPDELIKQQQRGLEIKYCDDLKSYKKYYYTLQENPKAIIVTVDDDMFYPSNMLKRLISIHNKYPKEIICHRAHKILFNKDGSMKKYMDWEWESFNFKGPSHLLLQTGVSGVLYPPESLHHDALNKEKFMKLCPKADDIWLKVMAMLNGTKVRKVSSFSRNFIPIEGSQDESLWNYNINDGGNDEQFKKIIKEYKIDYNIFYQ